jgi:6-phosphogluconolactonase (cycloisomerase 2 family)
MALSSRRISLLLTAVPLLSLAALTGCAGFFVYPGTSTSTTSSTGDYAYVSNSASGSNYINGYSLSGGSLVATTGSPYSLGFVPSAMVVSEANTFLYVASSATLSGTGVIYGYSIGTGGALTILNNGVGLEAENTSALDVSSDGQWLFSLNSDGLTLEEYGINTTTGLLTAEGNYPITATAGGVVTPNALKIAPSGAYIACALGTAGVDVFAFNTSTGVASSSAGVLPPANTASGFYSLAIDSGNDLFLGGTNGLVVYTVVANSNGSVTSTLASSSSGYTLGTGNQSVAVSKASGYVFAGSQNGGSGSTVYGYAIGTGGALTAVSGSPFNGPTDVAALARDSTGNYLLALGYSATSGTQLFTIGSAGALTSTSTAADGATLTIPSVLALTH